MLKTLRITTIITIPVVMCLVLLLAVSGLKGNSEIEQFLNSTTAVENFRNKNVQPEKAADKVPLLVQQAQKFALRIDPPPPPAPIKPPEPPKPKETVVKEAPIPTPKTQVSAKFSLLATCHSSQAPDKSIALLNIIGEGQKWLQTGDNIGHLTINEIKDGSIVLYQGNKKNDELFVPPPDTSKSLLKQDAGLSKIPRSSSATAIIQSAQDTAEQAAAADTAGIPVGTPIRAGTKPQLSAKPAQPQPEQVITPEEQKNQLDESISGVKKIIETPSAGISEQESRQEREIWERLLKSLEEEKKALEEQEQSSSN